MANYISLGVQLPVLFLSKIGKKITAIFPYMEMNAGDRE